MNEIDYTAYNISIDGHINVAKKGDIFTTKMLTLYAGHEDLLQEIVNDRERYEQDDDDNSETTVHVRNLLHIYDMYQETRVRDKDVAVSLYATCLWYIHQYINPPEIQYTELDGRENLRLLYNVIIDYYIKKYMIVTVHDRAYLFTGHQYVGDERDKILEANIEGILKSAGYSRTRQTTSIARDVIRRIKAESLVVGDDPLNTKTKQMVPVKNGVLFRKGVNQLLPKSPVWGFTFSLNANYDPDAPTEHIDDFLTDIVEGDDDEMLTQAVAQAILQNEKHQLAYILTGQGSNGKSTFIDLITTLMGQENISAISIQELIEDKFKVAELYGKLANLHADLPKTGLKTTGKFKTIVGGGDTISAERKFGHPFKFKNKATLIFSANELPEVDDTTFAFWRRWVIVQFPRTFGDDPTFSERLLTDENLSAFLNRVIEKMDQIEQHGLVRSQNAQDVMIMWQMHMDSVREFYHTRLDVAPGYAIRKDVIYARYQEFCDEMDYEPKPKNKFFESFKRITAKSTPKIVPVRHRIGTQQVQCISGVTFKNDNPGTDVILITPTPTPAPVQAQL